MTNFALELDDRAFAACRSGQLLASEPSAVLWSAGGASNACAGFKAWRALRLQPTAVSTRHLTSLLSGQDISHNAQALVESELACRMSEHALANGEGMWMTVPGCAQPAGLEVVLAITRRLALPIEGFIDAAVVRAAALGLERSAIILELGLHHAAGTFVDVDATVARRRRTVVSRQCGLIELYQMWLALIGSVMVKRTRFDPLHDAGGEQRIFDALPQLIERIETTGAATAEAQSVGQNIGVELTRDQLTKSAEPLYREMTNLIHELRPAGVAIDLVVPNQVAMLPGLREELERFGGCELHVIPEGFAGMATSLLELPANPSPEFVKMLRRLPVNRQGALADLTSRQSLGRARFGGPAPSHALLDGRGYPLGAEPLIVGRSTQGNPPQAGLRSIALPDGLAGVSRRHCTLIHDGSEATLLDHSAFGTFVNGERVVERVRVHPGDRVRIGDPGVELTLIAVSDSGVGR